MSSTPIALLRACASLSTSHVVPPLHSFPCEYFSCSVSTKLLTLLAMLISNSNIIFVNVKQRFFSKNLIHTFNNFHLHKLLLNPYFELCYCKYTKIEVRLQKNIKLIDESIKSRYENLAFFKKIKVL